MESRDQDESKKVNYRRNFSDLNSPAFRLANINREIMNKFWNEE